jgi:hypothetical protein
MEEMKKATMAKTCYTINGFTALHMQQSQPDTLPI